jgi:hypothetical protein
MQELLDRYPNGRNLLALSDRQLDALVLGIVTARANGDGITLPKFLSLGELENV